MNLFNRRFPVIVTIFLPRVPEAFLVYGGNFRIFKIGFSRYNFVSSYLGIFSFQSACMSCIIKLQENQEPPFEENYIIAKLTCVISVIAENIPHAHHKTHLHTAKVPTILIPSFHSLCKERVAYKLSPTDKGETTAFKESCSAKASSTNKTIYLPVLSFLANYHCQSPYFLIKSEYQSYSAFVFFLLLYAVSIKILPFQELRCITILIW